MDKEVEKLEEDKDVATAALITEVSEGAKVSEVIVQTDCSSMLVPHCLAFIIMRWYQCSADLVIPSIQ